MELKYTYALIIFFLGFMLGYLLNNGSDKKTSTALEINVTTDPDLAQATKLTNPFAVLSSQSKQTGTIEATELSKYKTIETGTFSNEGISAEPYSDVDIESKLANIGFLVSDNEIEQLASNLSDGSPYVRKQTILGLGDINSDESLRIVGQALMSDPIAENRIVAVSVLEKSLHVEFVEYLLTYAMQNDSESLVRQNAAQALGMEANVK